MVAQLDHRTDVAGRIEDHVPGQVGDLTGPQASLGGQQHDHAVTEGVPGAARKNQEHPAMSAELVLLVIATGCAGVAALFAIFCFFRTR